MPLKKNNKWTETLTVNFFNSSKNRSKKQLLFKMKACFRLQSEPIFLESILETTVEKKTNIPHWNNTQNSFSKETSIKCPPKRLEKQERS